MHLVLTLKWKPYKWRGGWDRYNYRRKSLGLRCWIKQANITDRMCFDLFGRIKSSIDLSTFTVFRNCYLHYGYNLPTFPEFELQPRDTAPTRFEKYVKHLNNMFTAMGITQASRKKVMLCWRGNLGCFRNSHRARTDRREWWIQNCHRSFCRLLRTSEACWSSHIHLSSGIAKVWCEYHRVLHPSSSAGMQCEFANSNFEIKRQIIQGTPDSQTYISGQDNGHTNPHNGRFRGKG